MLSRMSINALYFGSHWATGRLPFAIAHGPWPMAKSSQKSAFDSSIFFSHVAWSSLLCPGLAPALTCWLWQRLHCEACAYAFCLQLFHHAATAPAGVCWLCNWKFLGCVWLTWPRPLLKHGERWAWRIRSHQCWLLNPQRYVGWVLTLITLIRVPLKTLNNSAKVPIDVSWCCWSQRNC